MDLHAESNEKAYLWVCRHFEPLDELGKLKTLTIFAEFILVYADYQRYALHNKYDVTIPQDFMDCIRLVFPEAKIGRLGVGYNEGQWKGGVRIGQDWIEPKQVIYGVRYVQESCAQFIPDTVRTHSEYMKNRAPEKTGS